VYASKSASLASAAGSAGQGVALACKKTIVYYSITDLNTEYNMK
jgi:hypothetical protein